MIDLADIRMEEDLKNKVQRKGVAEFGMIVKGREFE